MKHFGIVQWVDFSRGVAPAPESEQMSEHLAAGCAECRGIVDFCADLSGACRGMSSGAPESAVQRARSIFKARLFEPPQRGRRIPVSLIFDSILAPSPAGLRASWQIGWQALYRAGECSLDIRIEPELHSSRASLIGQISNHLAPQTEMTDLPVLLKAGNTVVAQTRCNRFGEFQMEYEQQKRLQLYIYLDEGAKCIQAPLKKFVSEKSPGAHRFKAGLTPRKKRS